MCYNNTPSVPQGKFNSNITEQHFENVQLYNKCNLLYNIYYI